MDLIGKSNEAWVWIAINYMQFKVIAMFSVSALFCRCFALGGVCAMILSAMMPPAMHWLDLPTTYPLPTTYQPTYNLLSTYNLLTTYNVLTTTYYLLLTTTYHYLLLTTYYLLLT